MNIQGRITKTIPPVIAACFKLLPGQKIEISRALGKSKVLIFREGVETIIDKKFVVHIKYKKLIKKHKTGASIGGIPIYELFYKTDNKRNH